MQLVRQTGKKNPFIVTHMMQNDFFKYSELLKNQLQMKKINSNGEKFVWKNIKWLRFKKTNMGTLFYKETLNIDEPFKSISLCSKGRSHYQITPPLCYNRPVPIAEKKKKDLLDLLPMIPNVFHDFYKNLPTDATLKEIYPNNETDSEEENS